jgi:hypothetical protein
MSTMVLPRTGDELPPLPEKARRIPELVDEEERLTAAAYFYYVAGDRDKARELLDERNLVIRPVLLGLRCMLFSPPSKAA